MRRFQTFITEARPDRTPWDPMPADAIQKIASRCEASDVVEIIEEIEALELEKGSVPAWDGDTSDDITRAQELFARILAALPAAQRDVLFAAFSNAGDVARRWVALAQHETSKSVER